jgi:hypothetical protein
MGECWELLRDWSCPEIALHYSNLILLFDRMKAGAFWDAVIPAFGGYLWC